MKPRFAFGRYLASGLIAVAAMMGAARSVRADYAYGFAKQTISGLTITPTITAVGGVTTSTLDGATVNGSGISNSDPTDVAQAYLGGAPASSENFFARYATGAFPSSPAGNFTRGDAALSTAAPNFASVVAESFLNTSTTTSLTGNSGLTASLNFKPSSTGGITISYAYSNDIYVYATGSGSSSASYGFNITIKDLAGAIVFNSSTAATNLSLAALPIGPEVIGSGNESVTTGQLTAGSTYSIIFSESAQTSARVKAVPEPASMALLGVGGLWSTIMFRRRKMKS